MILIVGADETKWKRHGVIHTKSMAGTPGGYMERLEECITYMIYTYRGHSYIESTASGSTALPRPYFLGKHPDNLLVIMDSRFAVFNGMTLVYKLKTAMVLQQQAKKTSNGQENQAKRGYVDPPSKSLLHKFSHNTLPTSRPHFIRKCTTMLRS